MSYRIMVGLAVLSVLALAGCSKEPVAEVQAAEQALAQAQSAEAPAYAGPAYAEAQQKMTELRTELEAQKGKMGMMRKYDRATELAAEVNAAGTKAATEAQANKKAAMEEAQRTIQEARLALTEAMAMLDQAPMGKGSAADLEMLRQDLIAAETSLKDVESSFAGANYIDATAKAQAVLVSVQRVQAEVAAAIEAKAAAKGSRG